MGALQDRVAWVTGGSSGIGRATALAMARAGASVVVHGLNDQEITEVVNQIEGEGGRAMGVRADVSQAEEMQEAARRIVRHFGRIDVVFANAGINGVWAPIEDIKPEEWDQTLGINLKGTFLTIKYAAPELRKRRGAVIICASVNGTRMFSNSGATAYACSKAAQVTMTKMLALEMADDGVRVNAVCPGAIQSGIHEKTVQRNTEEVKEPVEFPEGKIPLTDGQVPEADVVADVVVFLASDAARHVTGSVIFVDGAQSLLQG